MEKTMIEKLIDTAIKQLDFSYTPYSGFKVGAALLTKKGEIYTGCNIENASYTPTNCAERTAFFKAVSEGKRDFKAIAVVGGPTGKAPGMPENFCTPCGVCRQVMAEFCHPEDFEIIMACSDGAGGFCMTVRTLNQLLPDRFGLADQVK